MPTHSAAFPIVTGEVHYPARGPRSIFYWLQTVTVSPVGAEAVSEVDALHGSFYTVGHRPLFMDSPANPHHPDGEWLARTALFLAPGVIVDDELHGLVGFTWGYRLAAGVPVELLSPQEASEQDWELVLSVFSAAEPGVVLSPPAS